LTPFDTGAGHFFRRGATISALTVSALGHFGTGRYGARRFGAGAVSAAAATLHSDTNNTRFIEKSAWLTMLVPDAILATE